MLRCCCWRLRWWALDHTAADGEDSPTRLPSNSTANQHDIILCSLSFNSYCDFTGFGAILRHAQFCVLRVVLLARTTMFGSTSLDLMQVQDLAVLSDCLSFMQRDYLQVQGGVWHHGSACGRHIPHPPHAMLQAAIQTTQCKLS